MNTKWKTILDTFSSVVSKWFRNTSVLKIILNLYLPFYSYLEHAINSAEIITKFFICIGPSVMDH